MFQLCQLIVFYLLFKFPIIFITLNSVFKLIFSKIKITDFIWYSREKNCSLSPVWGMRMGMGMGLVTGAHAPVEWHDTQATATKTAKAIKKRKAQQWRKCKSSDSGQRRRRWQRRWRQVEWHKTSTDLQLCDWTLEKMNNFTLETKHTHTHARTQRQQQHANVCGGDGERRMQLTAFYNGQTQWERERESVCGEWRAQSGHSSMANTNSVATAEQA